MKLNEILNEEQMAFDFEPPKTEPTRPTRGDVIHITPRGVKVFGMKSLLGPGDWVEVNGGGSMKIIELGKGKVRLEDGKIYGPHNLRYSL